MCHVTFRSTLQGAELPLVPVEKTVVWSPCWHETNETVASISYLFFSKSHNFLVGCFHTGFESEKSLNLWYSLLIFFFFFPVLLADKPSAFMEHTPVCYPSWSGFLASLSCDTSGKVTTKLWLEFRREMHAITMYLEVNSIAKTNFSAFFVGFYSHH